MKAKKIWLCIKFKFLENNFYLLLHIRPFRLGWELPQNYFLQLRVLCLGVRLYNVYLNMSVSKSCLIIQLCHITACFYLQVLLVLCLVSPLNDLLVVLAVMVLKFEKEVKPMNTSNQVLYISSSFGLLGVESREFSQADKEITA